ncbi:MAG: YceD family protein [Beutenbergiaceae bacterium]
MSGSFVISTHDLERRPGSMRQLTVRAAAAQPLGNEVIAVPAGGPIELAVRLESVSEGVLVTGHAHAVATGECVRCLQQVTEPVDADFTELFSYPGLRRAHPDERPEDDDVLPELDGDLADLEPTVTDALVPALPFQPLCDRDCQGLCAGCGIPMAQAEPGHAHELLDPRWAALAEFSGTESAPREDRQ